MTGISTKQEMIPADGVAPQARDWRRQWRDCVRDPAELLDLLGLSQLAPRLAADCAGFPLRVPREFIGRMRYGDPQDPLLRQVLPLDAELRPAPGFSFDAVGDLDTRSAPGVLQKYEGRALLIATGSCAVNCRYCFRRHFPYAEETAAASSWRLALEALASDPGINEVILSGGDPLSLGTAKLVELTTALRDIPHVKRLRLHTRLPIVLPSRVDDALCAWLDSIDLQKVMVIHANHASEFDAEVDAALADVSRTGTTLLNQSVLLRGVNDSVDALVAVSERQFAAGVLPYYLHQLDRVQGAAHFLVSDRRARWLMAEVRKRLPGYLVPRLVREVPGEGSKRPM